MKTLASPFENDPFAMIAEAFRRLYGKPYTAQLAPFQCDDHENKRKQPFGQTFFPEDSSEPIVTVYLHTPFEHAPEIFAHELAHVAVGQGKGHGAEWQQAFHTIYKEYIKIGEEMFGADEPKEE